MWLYLKSGFFSVVQNRECKKGELVVRARCRDDIETLRTRLLKDYGFDGKVIDSPKSDYAHRMYVPKDVLAKFVASAVTEINYPNFKDTIPMTDKLRHEVYFDCWDAMFNWQRRLKR